MEPTQLYLIRHGEVEEKYHRVFGGSRVDMNLSTRGHQQARAMADYVSKVKLNTVYVSPMKRAQQTVQPLLEKLDCRYHTHPDLHEVDFGDWTGLSWQELHDKHQISAFSWLEMMENATVPNGECAKTFRKRVDPVLQEILRQHQGDKVAVVCHGGVIRMMLSILLDLPLPKTSHFEIEYASVTRLELLPGKHEIQLLNFTPWRDLLNHE
jgi:alpha-ribazole phosphatase